MQTNRYRRNQLESPLLRLPAELRNKIYTCVLTEGAIRVSTLFTLSNGFGYHVVFDTISQPDNGTRGRFATLLYLPHVCRQLRSETTTMVYRLNPFDVELQDLESLVRILPEEVRKITTAFTMTACMNAQNSQSSWEHTTKTNLEALVHLPSLQKITVPCILSDSLNCEGWKRLIRRYSGLEVEVIRVTYCD